MKTIVVESATLATVAYDVAREVLQLEFRDGGVYQYFEVPADIYEALLHAKSKGQYFNLAIRGRFQFERG
jgi:KTSC domain-containing protein